MTLSRELRTAVEAMVQEAIRNLHFDAVLGKGDDAKTLFVAGRPNYVWARVGIPTRSIQIVRCTKITPAYGLQVLLWYDRDNVLSVATQDDSQAEKFYDGRVVGNAGPHNLSHGYFGMDPVLLDGRQFLPLLCQPNSPQDLSVRVRSCILYDSDGGATAFAGGNIDLTAHVPSSANEQRIVIVGLNIGTKTLTATLGSVKTVAALDTTNIPFSDAEAAAIAVSSAVIPIMAIRLFNGQTQITPHDLFKDMRPYFTLPWLTSGSESGGESAVTPGFSQLRLTTVSGDPVPEGNNSASDTIYYTKYKGWQVNLYNTTTTKWEAHAVSGEISASIAGLTASHVYDVFFDNSETLTFVDWGGSSTRATALGDQDGIRVMASDKSKLYIGKILIDSGGGTCTQSVGSVTNLGVSNYYNRHPMPIGAFPSADSWLYNSDTVREWGGGTVRATMVTEPDGFLHALLSATINSPAGNQGVVGFGLNSTTTFTSGLKSTSRPSRIDNYEVAYNTAMSEGLNVLTANERCSINAGGNVTFYGDAGAPTYFQMGFTGWSLQ